MRISDIGTANPEALALAAVLDDGDAEFDEAAEWIADLAAGKLKD